MTKDQEFDALEEGITDAIYNLTYTKGTLTLSHDEAREHAKSLITLIRTATLDEADKALRFIKPYAEIGNGAMYLIDKKSAIEAIDNLRGSDEQ